MASQMKKPTLAPTFNRFDLLSEDNVFLILDSLKEHPLDRKSFSLVSRSLCAVESRHRTSLKPLRVEFLAKILCRFPNVSILDLSLCPVVNDASLSVIGRFCKENLRSIDLSRSKSFSELGLAKLIRTCGNLIELNLSNAFEITDSAAEVIAELKNLEKLWLSKCRLITDVGVGFIAEGCGKLNVLSLNWCYLVGDKGVGLVVDNCKELRRLDLSHLPVSNKCLSQIFSELPHLEDLAIEGCFGINEALTAPNGGCKSLERLDMTSCEKVSPVGLSSVTTAAPNLRQIILSHSSCVDHALVGSLRKLSSLQTLKLDGCTVTSLGLKAIGECCLSLMELSLCKCVGVTDEGICYLFSERKPLRKLDLTCCRNITALSVVRLTASCPSLVSLKMRSCWSVSERGFFWIGQRCRSLEELDLTNTAVDDEGLMSISLCTRLEILKLGICLGVTYLGLIHISMRCPKLKEVEVYGSDNIGDACISAIVDGCPDLEKIYIAYCDSITDQSLISLSKCSKLKKLEAQECTGITNDGLAAIAMGCKQLSRLNIKSCHNIDDYGMIPLAQFSQNLKQIDLSYTSVTDAGLLSLASIGCLQTITILHFAGLTPDGLAAAFSACAGLTKVELPAPFKSSFPKSFLKHLEARGSTFIWSHKYQAELDPRVRLLGLDSTDG